MPCSEKKRLSDLANSSRSTGPKSKQGKAKVAPNSLKHGLRSAQVVLPGEDAAAFDRMVASWMDDWQPPTDARRVLVEQAVAHAWRLRRWLELERAHLVERGRRAARAREQAAAAKARAAVAALPEGTDTALAAELAEFIAGEVARLEAHCDERFATPEQRVAWLAQDAALDDPAGGRSPVASRCRAGGRARPAPGAEQSYRVRPRGAEQSPPRRRKAPPKAPRRRASHRGGLDRRRSDRPGPRRVQGAGRDVPIESIMIDENPPRRRPP